MRIRSIALSVVVLALAATVGLLGCGSSGGGQTTSIDPNAAEVSPAGDIPDNQAFVAYNSPSGFQVKVPEGWSRSTQGDAVTYTDKLNSIRIESASASSAPTEADANAELQKLSSTVSGFKAGTVTTVHRSAGDAIFTTYTGNGPADPVTGKTVSDAFERYVFFNKGTAVTLTLSGPVGADNVDPWMIVTDSLRWTQ